MAKGKKITLYDIARLAGTSKSTVSRILNGGSKVSEDVRRRVERVIKEHGYHPSFAAQTLSHGRKGLIGVISTGLETGYYVKVLQGIDYGASARGRRMLFSIVQNPREYVDLLKTLFGQGLVDGCILVAPPVDIFKAALPCRTDSMVLCSCKGSSANGWGRVPSVTVDNRQAFDCLLRKLYKNGARRFVFIAGPENIYDCMERRKSFEGYVAGVKGVSAKVLSGNLSAGQGKDALLKYLRRIKKMPDAVVCVNDSNAVGAREVLRDFSPQTRKVIVTGCDGEEFAGLLKIPTLRMPMFDLGKMAAVKLLAGSGNELHTVLPLKLQDY